MKTYRLAMIPGDGIGVEVTGAAMQILEATAARHGFALAPQWFDWSCAHYRATGAMMPSPPSGLQPLHHPRFLRVPLAKQRTSYGSPIPEARRGGPRA